jgi:thiol-disulfide isomerase/thioredoxin
MSLRLLLFALFSSSLFSFGQTKEIKFEHSSFADVQALAKKENKLIFLDAYTTWCGPCKWMSKKVFTNDSVADFFNANFINLKMDMESEEGKEIARKYSVRCYPNLLFLNNKGEVIHRSGGAKQPQDFISFATQALNNSGNTFNYFSSNYDSKKMESDFLIQYMSYLSTTCLPMDSIVSDYFQTQNEIDYSNRINWELIKKHVNDSRSPVFLYLIKNSNTFSSKYTLDSVQTKINSVYLTQGKRIVNSKKDFDEDFKSYRNEIASSTLNTKNTVLFYLDLDYYAKKEDWTNYGNTLLEGGDSYLKPDSYNAVVWNMYLRVENPKVLEKGAEWMKKLLNTTTKKEVYAEYDTYASILYKLHKKNDALAAANKAIEIAKSLGMDPSQYEETTELLSKINQL